MPAPLGNKYAVGNSGKPKQFDIEAEAKDLIEWSKKPEALVLRKHGPLRGYHSATMNRWAEENQVYREAYNMAKDLIGARREELLIINQSSAPFQRYAKWYDQSLEKHEREEKAYEASLKNESEEKPSKVVFEVNYGAQDKIEVSPKRLSKKDSKVSR